jgi:hypothetical protein
MASIEDVKDVIKTSFADYGGASLTKLGFIALRVMMEANLPQFSTGMSPWQNKIRAVSYNSLTGVERVTKLLLHLNSFLNETSVGIIDTSIIGPESTINQCYTVLRRQLDALVDGSTRAKPPPPEPPAEPDLGDIIIDANNRFSCLFVDHGGEDHGFYLEPESEIVPSVRLTLEEKRYKTQAQSNATRKKMGYPPKGTASLDSREFSLIAKRAEQEENTVVVINKVYRPLFKWRKEYLHEYRAGKLKKEDLTIVPLTLIGVYEQWFLANDKPDCRQPFPRKHGLDGIPRVWDERHEVPLPRHLRDGVTRLIESDAV